MRFIKKYSFLIAIVGLALMFSISACSTKKNGWTRRAYHNLTCHYNVYWNGMMSLDEGEKSLREGVKDDYSRILRVYNYGDKKDAKRIYPKMDRTIKKASIGIQRHSMYFGGKEQVKWIDDSYMMMGKAHFYKHDFISARRIFKYVSTNFPDDPVQYEAYLWLAKTHIGAERYEKAVATINLLQSKLDEKDFPLEVEKQIPLVLADFYLAQEQYDKSYPYLERSLELNNKIFIVTRVDFILGQINQMEGNNQLATHYFKRVVNKNPDYVMAFEAKMNLAETYASETGDSKGINKILNKMLKEARNEEFRDQIYYALAQVAKKDNNDTLTINYLRESVRTSIKNNVQKTKSSLEVADMFFERQNYQFAQAYYDTAVSSLPRDYPDYDNISYKAGVLTNLITQAQTIKEQDSLQFLASMDTTELLAIIDQKIEDFRIAEEERLEEEQELAEGGGIQFIDPKADKGRGTSLGGGGWYFYNQQAMSMGFSEFVRKWGNRKLEDNWRLSDKRMMLQSLDGDDDIVSDSTVADTSRVSKSPMDRSFYLAGIPNTPDKIAASDIQIIEAFNKLGFIYLMELNDSIAAKETFIEFQKRFPENEYRLESWHGLYKIYMAEKNFSEADYYKNLILNNYPESTYAKVILNPDYYTLFEEEKQKASELYMRTYEAFKQEKYYRVISYSNRGMDLYPDDTAVMPRFMYLRALSLGKVDTHDTLYASLNNLITTYPASPVTPRAISLKTKLQLEYGLGTPPDTTGQMGGDGDNKMTEPSIYSLNENDVHFVMFVVNNKNVKVNALKIRLSDFNGKYFSLMRLKTKSLMLNKDQTIVTVGNFKNKNEALNYYGALENDTYVLSGVDENEYDLFPISTTNYPLFYRDKSVSAYKDFYDKNYKRD